QLRLPGPYILGIQVWTSEFPAADPELSDVVLRLLELPARRLFPEPSATIMTPVIDGLRAQGLLDDWYHIVGPEWAQIRVVVSGDPRYRILCEFRGAGVAPCDVIVNLAVASKPPDATAIQLVQEMNAGIERWKSASNKLMVDTIEAALQQGLKR
ncbi:unnamed protein product, partial [marine sediment metagenome]